MTLPLSGSPISLSQANVELTLPSTAQISLNDANVRLLWGYAPGLQPLGGIPMSDGYGKAWTFTRVIPSGADNTDMNLRSWCISAGWNQVSPVVITLATGAVIRSTSIASAALTIDGSFPNGLTFINNGYIIGKGGAGGMIGYNAPEAGGTALSVSTACNFYNNGTIGGGGGGGGASGDFGNPYGWIGGGGGAGYGLAGWGTYWIPPGYGTYWVYNAGYGNGSSLLLPSTGNCTWTSNFPGYESTHSRRVLTGAGGTLGAAGGASEYAYQYDSKYGIWYPMGGSNVGAAGGAAVSGNSYITNITWYRNGTILGVIA